MKRLHQSRLANVRSFICLCVANASFFTSPTCFAQYQFAESVRLPLPVNTDDAWESTPSISASGLELFYSSFRNNGGVAVSTREAVAEPFGGHEPILPELLHPSLSLDGLTLYGNGDFGPNGEADVAYVTRDTIRGAWSEPTTIGNDVNSRSLDRFPSISPDGLELYFQRSSSFTSSDGDMWVAKRNRVDEEFGTAKELPEELNIGWAAPGGLSSDGLTLFFSSSRPGGFGRDDLYLTSREDKDSPWGSPVNLGPFVNTDGLELYPRMSFDGTALYFSRAPASFNIDNSSTWQSDIYVAHVVPEPSGLTWVTCVTVASLMSRRKRS